MTATTSTTTTTDPNMVLSMVVKRLEGVLDKENHDLTDMSSYDVNLVRNMWNNQFTLNLRGIVDKMIEDDRYIQQTSDDIIDIFHSCYDIDFEIDGFIMKPVVGCKYNTKYVLIDNWWYDEDDFDENGEIIVDSDE